MKLVSTLALAAILATSGATLAAPAFAQGAAAAKPAAPQRKFNFTKGAQKALADLQKAANAGDPATFPTALAAAQAAAKNADDRYFIAQMQLAYATKTNSDADKSTAVDAIIASGGALPDEMDRLYRAQADFALNAKDYDKAMAAYAKVLETNPGDAAVLNNMVVLHRERKAYPQAFALVRQAINATKTSGQPVSENMYRLGLQTALDGQMKAEVVPITRELLVAHPTPKSWATALNVYRSVGGLDEQATLDLLRLMRAAKVMENERDYLELADELDRRNLPGEVKSVLDEGIAARKVVASKPGFRELVASSSGKVAADRASLPEVEGKAAAAANGRIALNTADAYYGYGQYDKAAQLYRLALQKGSVDANLVNTRLGMSLAHAGKKAEAEAAFKAVTGPRADLAGLWMLWLNQRG